MTASLVSQEVLLISAFFPLQVACHGDALRVNFEPSSRRMHRLTAYSLLHEGAPQSTPPPHPTVPLTSQYCLFQASQVALVVKKPPASVGDVGSIPGWGRSSGGGHGNPLQYSCLEVPMDRGGLQSIGSQS